MIRPRVLSVVLRNGVAELANARSIRVAERLGIPHYVLNMETQFTHDVLDDFVSEYARGRTPIPCVRCNTFTKFQDLLHTADAIDAPWLATGHYARIGIREGVSDGVPATTRVLRRAGSRRQGKVSARRSAAADPRAIRASASSL